MINYSNAIFIKSASKLDEAPGKKLPEVLLCGKSNVGKSTFINCITNKKKMAYTSSKPGHTQLLNYYEIDNRFYLVDAPGYGYACKGVDLDKIFADMMNEYFHNNNLKLVVILLDSRRKLSENDIEIINYIDSISLPYFIVFTKEDKLNQKEHAALEKYLKEIGLVSPHFYASSLKPKSFDLIKVEIENVLKK